MTDKDYVAGIRAELGEDLILSQLAEECAELIQVCSKIIRNKTINVSMEPDQRARKHLLEETADVLCCMDIAGLLDDPEQIYAIVDQKTARWWSRLRHRRA